MWCWGATLYMLHCVASMVLGSGNVCAAMCCTVLFADGRLTPSRVPNAYGICITVIVPLVATIPWRSGDARATHSYAWCVHRAMRHGNASAGHRGAQPQDLPRSGPRCYTIDIVTVHLYPGSTVFQCLCLQVVGVLPTYHTSFSKQGA